MKKIVVNSKDYYMQTFTKGLRLVQVEPNFKHISMLFPAKLNNQDIYLFDILTNSFNKDYFIMDAKTLQVKSISKIEYNSLKRKQNAPA